MQCSETTSIILCIWQLTEKTGTANSSIKDQLYNWNVQVLHSPVSHVCIFPFGQS